MAAWAVAVGVAADDAVAAVVRLDQGLAGDRPAPDPAAGHQAVVAAGP